MSKLELTLTHNEVESIVKQWVNKNYTSLEVESISTLTKMEFDGKVGYSGETVPKFKGFAIQVNEKEVK